jgi:tRNA-dihydrouridine synthase A
VVHQLKRERPHLVLELNGGLDTLEVCQAQLAELDGVMVGRAVYQHPLRWASVDRVVFADSTLEPARPSSVVRGLIPHAERWCSQGGRLWAIGRHLVHLVEGVKGARGWRASLSRHAGERHAGAEVLDAAALQLEERGL